MTDKQEFSSLMFVIFGLMLVAILIFFGGMRECQNEHTQRMKCIETGGYWTPQNTCNPFRTQ